MASNIVIIGSGHAGGMAAILLRQKKFNGSITIIGEEGYFPYQKPALSKTFLSGKIREETLFLKKQDFYERNKIRLLLNRKVISIDRNKKTVVLDDNHKLPFSKLIIATGSELIKINSAYNQENVCYLKTIDDAKYLKSLISKKKRICIIGAGYIGLEIAATAINKNMKVCIVEYADRPMNRSSSLIVSQFFQLKHEANGVNFIFNNSAKDIKNNCSSKQIILSNKSIIDTDIVAVGIGVKPKDKIAIQADLKCNNGIIVDENCLTSDDNIFAIGDCTNHNNKIYDLNIRLESVHNAVEQAKTAVAYLIGSPKPYNQVPWFWSDQYNCKLQIAGVPSITSETILRGSLEDENFAAYSIRKGKVISVETVNSIKEFKVGKKLIENQVDVTANQIEDQSFNLMELLKKCN
jgi:3-phenylpropionate/trans-cinnamate dioxygenase ferredoxin reductase component